MIAEALSYYIYCDQENCAAFTGPEMTPLLTARVAELHSWHTGRHAATLPRGQASDDVADFCPAHKQHPLPSPERRQQLDAARQRAREDPLTR